MVVIFISCLLNLGNFSNHGGNSNGNVKNIQFLYELKSSHNFAAVAVMLPRSLPPICLGDSTVIGYKVFTLVFGFKIHAWMCKGRNESGTKVFWIRHHDSSKNLVWCKPSIWREMKDFFGIVTAEVPQTTHASSPSEPDEGRVPTPFHLYSVHVSAVLNLQFAVLFFRKLSCLFGMIR